MRLDPKPHKKIRGLVNPREFKFSDSVQNADFDQYEIESKVRHKNEEILSHKSQSFSGLDVTEQHPL